jgi:small subunit ribosomal protein S7e
MTIDLVFPVSLQ